MKIIYYSRPSFADCDYPLVKALRELGHDVYFFVEVAPASMKSTLFNISKLFPKSGIYGADLYPELKMINRYVGEHHSFIINRVRPRNPLSVLLLLCKKIWTFSQIKPDVVHFVGDSSFFDTPLIWWFRSKSVITVHDPILHSSERTQKKERIRKIQFSLIRKIILLNTSQEGDFVSRYSIPLSRISFSRLGVYELTNLFGHHKTDGKYVLFFGRISEYKGVRYLLDAMCGVHEKFPDVSLRVIGAGSYSFDVAPYIEKKFIQIENRFMDIEELASVVRSSLFVVCPYTDATQSGVVSTAFSVGTPVIVTRVGGLPEMVEEGKTGLIVEPKNIETLASAMTKLLDDEVLRGEMRRTIDEQMSAGFFSWKEIAKDYIAIYNS